MSLTIDKKVSLFISIMILVFGTVSGIYIIRAQTEHMRHDLDEGASVLLSNLAFNLEYPAMIRDSEAISRLVGGVMAQKEMVSCRVEGNDGRILYQKGKKGDGSVREFVAPITAGKTEEAEDLIIGNPGKITEEVGKVYLGVSLAELNKNIADMRRAGFTVVAIAIIMASLATSLLLRRLVGRPVKQLVTATRRIAAGDLAHKVSLTTGDEFEALGNSFDRMTASLRDAQEELVRREKLSVLGQLAGGVGNELRNPLGVMSNAVFFLKDVFPDTDKQVREYLEIIDSEIDNSQRIISDFIDFFRMEKPQPKAVEIHEFIARSIELSAISDRVSLRVDIPQDLPPVRIDPSQMRQVFQNLITNAVQAMQDGGTLRIGARPGSRFLVPGSNQEPRTENQELDADFIEISVEDTGTGIAPENMEKVFQPLFTTKSRGIGLGLAIGKSFVEANGGRIEVESRLGEGTTFTVALPVERAFPPLKLRGPKGPKGARGSYGDWDSSGGNLFLRVLQEPQNPKGG